MRDDSTTLPGLEQPATAPRASRAVPALWAMLCVLCAVLGLWVASGHHLDHQLATVVVPLALILLGVAVGLLATRHPRGRTRAPRR